MRWIVSLLPVVLWLAWWYPYFFRAPKLQKRESITVSTPSRAGLLLETLAIFFVCLFRIPGAPRTNLGIIAAALLFGAVGVVLMWTAIQHLGRQFRIYAGLYHDHQLVRTGPYAFVRHPIYASLLAMTVSTGLLLARWPWLLAAIALSIAGTEIRVRTEDQLLSSRFGADFSAYRKSVSAYLPFFR
jgi:protein-S-isoprenylcysteine O-methyltransferase Ste14